MVNMDLPWNPMQIEQRLGRLHRVGQAHDVLLTNLVASGTIEEHVLRVLEAKINLFELVIGELDMILGRVDDDFDFEATVFDAFVASGDDAEFSERMGLCRVLGMPPGEEPTRFLAESNGDVVTGALLGTAGTECPYHIYCRDGQAAEVLPFPVGDDGAFWGFYWCGQRSGGRWAVGRIVSAKGLDPVEGPLAVTGSAWNGLPVAARALAAWARIAGHHERLLSAHTARPVAAAVNRLVACRAGGRATFAEGAGQFRVPEQDVRRADRAVRTPLALGPGQPW